MISVYVLVLLVQQRSSLHNSLIDDCTVRLSATDQFNNKPIIIIQLGARPHSVVVCLQAVATRLVKEEAD
jgi:hypothetical protein